MDNEHVHILREENVYATTSLADCNYIVIYVRVLVKCFCLSGYDSASHILFISFSKCLKRVLNISLGGGVPVKHVGWG